MFDRWASKLNRWKTGHTDHSHRDHSHLEDERPSELADEPWVSATSYSPTEMYYQVSATAEHQGNRRSQEKRDIHSTSVAPPEYSVHPAISPAALRNTPLLARPPTRGRRYLDTSTTAAGKMKTGVFSPAVHDSTARARRKDAHCSWYSTESVSPFLISLHQVPPRSSSKGKTVLAESSAIGSPAPAMAQMRPSHRQTISEGTQTEPDRKESSLGSDDDLADGWSEQSSPHEVTLTSAPFSTRKGRVGMNEEDHLSVNSILGRAQGHILGSTGHTRYQEPGMLREIVKPEIRTVNEPVRMKSIHLHEHQKAMQPMTTNTPSGGRRESYWAVDQQTGELFNVPDELDARTSSSTR